MSPEKDGTKAAFTTSGFFVLRTPLFSRDEIDRLSEDLVASQTTDDLGALEAALAADRRRIRARLGTWLQSPAVREALFIASPKLDDQLTIWFTDPDSERGEKVERALVRYFARMTARPTPFGLFAGCSLGRIGSSTSLTIEGLEACAKHTRLDMDYLTELASKLESDPELRRHLLFRVNSSLYDTGGRLRYAEARVAGKARSYGLVAVEATDYLVDTLHRARDGATLADLAEPLVDDEVSRDEAEEYVGELIDSQILVSDLAPQVTGREPIDDMIERLDAFPAERSTAAALEDARAALDKLDGSGVGVDRAEYEAVAHRLRDLPAEVEPGRLFQVDMTRRSRNLSLGPAVAAELGRAVEVLRRISRPAEQEALDSFRTNFVVRYEGREVPLLEALDEESGIGFDRTEAPGADASPLLEGFHFPPRPTETRWTSQDTHLLRLQSDAIARGSNEIVLSNADVEALSSEKPATLPDAFAVPSIIAAASERDVDRGRFSLSVHGVYGPSGARLLGRFCYADPELHEAALDHLRAEEALDPESVFAEIVHLPEGRVGNILLRPVLRDYEIPFLGRSGAPTDRQIPVSDLNVSVVEGRIVLRSRRLGREVVPRLTSAHNYSWRSLGVYRFLCALQNQGNHGGVMWRWGPLEDAPFLPRVRYGRSVLSRARWNVDAAEVAAAIKEHGAARFAALRAWRRARGIPRLVSLADFDNELLVDLENVVSVDSFVHVAGRRKTIRLVEAWPEPEELPVRGPDGRYVAELVVPFVREGQRRVPLRPTPQVPGVRRTFPPGSDWLYAKVYTGASTADRILCASITPLIERFRAAGLIDAWFFVRYSDPDWHLRVRLHSPHGGFGADVASTVHEVLGDAVDRRLAWKIELGTYEREVERYGGPAAMELAERVFSADSDAVLEVLPLLSGDEAADARWRLALCGIHSLLEDFGVSGAERAAAVRSHRDSLAREFRTDAVLRRQLGQRYRQERNALQALVDRGETEDPVVDAGLQALRRRSERLRPFVARYREMDAGGDLTQDLATVVMSFVHMHVNRLLRSTHRAQELVLHDLLDRLYASIAARS